MAVLPLSVWHDVDLQIDATWPEENCVGSFQIKGPKEQLRTALGEDEFRKFKTNPGVISPLDDIPDRSSHGGCLIPIIATQVAYLYPYRLQSNLMELASIRHPWAFALLLGGFAYFDKANVCVGINAVMHCSSKEGFVLGGPYDCDELALEALQAQKRLRFVTLQTMRDAGFRKFAWVHRGEFPGGHRLNSARANHYGAFVYTMQEKSKLKQNAIFYILMPGGGSMVVRAATQSMSKYMISRSVPSHVGCLLSKATQSVQKISAVTQKKKKALGGLHVVKLRGLRTSKLTLKEQFVNALKGFMVLVLYLVMGMFWYKEMETIDCDRNPWYGTDCDGKFTYIDAMYLSIVSISTVGYGDFVPSTRISKVFTAIYILFGVAVIFTLTGSAVDAVIDWMERGWRKMLAVVCRGGVRPSARSNLNQANHSSADTAELAADAPKVSSTWFYFRELHFYFLWGAICTQLIAAYMFVLLDPHIDMETALWHCFITAATVGYGDVKLHTQVARAWASVHILVSVNWLTGLINRAIYTYKMRQLLLQRAAIVAAQLDMNVIDRFHKTAVGGVGMVTEIDFLFGMLDILGVELCGQKLNFDTDVQPLIDKFEALDADNNGYLEKEDLEFMIRQHRKETGCDDVEDENKPDNQAKPDRGSNILSGISESLSGIRARAPSIFGSASVAPCPSGVPASDRDRDRDRAPERPIEDITTRVPQTPVDGDTTTLLAQTTTLQVERRHEHSISVQEISAGDVTNFNQ